MLIQQKELKALSGQTDETRRVLKCLEVKQKNAQVLRHKGKGGHDEQLRQWQLQRQQIKEFINWSNWDTPTSLYLTKLKLVIVDLVSSVTQKQSIKSIKPKPTMAARHCGCGGWAKWKVKKEAPQLRLDSACCCPRQITSGAHISHWWRWLMWS